MSKTTATYNPPTNLRPGDVLAIPPPMTKEKWDVALKAAQLGVAVHLPKVQREVCEGCQILEIARKQSKELPNFLVGAASFALGWLVGLIGLLFR